MDPANPLSPDPRRDGSGLVAYKVHPFQVRPSPPFTLLQPGNLLDGMRGLGFRPSMLVLATVGNSPADVTAQSPAPFPNINDGGITVQLYGLLPSGGYWLRRFTLAAYRSAVFDISAYEDVRIEVLNSTLQTFGVAGQIGDYELKTTPRDPLLLSEVYETAARYDVPPGAVEMFPGQNDPAFAWRGVGVPVSFNMPEPVAVGTPTTPKGQLFVTSIANYQAVWRIER